ncbi:hypothetical protein ACFL1X_07800 [Candidatus Hydrogenedentota bacterium]
MSIDNRNKRALVICGAALAAAALYLVVIEPTFATLSKLTKDLPKREKNLQTMLALKADNEEIENGLTDLHDKMMRRGNSFSLYTYLKSIWPKDIDQTLSTQPKKEGSSKEFRETSVSATLDGVSMEQAMEFMYKIYQADKLLKVDSLALSRSGKSRGGMKAILLVSTVTPAK